MKINGKETHKPGGFTLIEVLIAIFIFSMVITAVFTSFREISLSANIVNKTGAVYEMIQGATAVISRDLESVYVDPKISYAQKGFNDDPDPYRFESKMDLSVSEPFPMLRFTTLAHLPVNRDTRNGVAEVVYYMDETEEYGWVLRRSDRIFFHKEFEKRKTHPTLLRHVKTLTLTYYDEDAEEHEEWNSDSDESGYATPSAVKLRMDIEDEGRILPFEMRIDIPCFRTKAE